MTTTITWHPYPQDNPPKRGQYICTAIDPNDGTPYTIASGWWKTDDGSYDWSVVGVTAWAELPKPYKP